MALELQSIKILTHELFFYKITLCNGMQKCYANTLLRVHYLKNKYDNTSKGCVIFNLRLDSHQNHSVAIKILD